MSLGNQYENNVLDAILGQGFTPDATVYYALFTATPSDTGGGTEVTGAGYARVGVTNNATNFPNAASGEKTNGADVVFPEATGNYPADVTHWGILNHVTNAASATNLIVYGSLVTPKTVLSGTTPRILAGELSIIAD